MAVPLQRPEHTGPVPLTLLVESSSGAWQQVQVDRLPFVIGRLRECDLTLRDSRISRRHAHILFRDGAYAVEDLRSRHGLAVNGARTAHAAIVAGDRIEFGVEDSYRVTVCESANPKADLLKKVSNLPTGPGRTRWRSHRKSERRPHPGRDGKSMPGPASPRRPR